MGKNSFQIFYDGPSLQSHEMDVRDLAPALIAIGDLLDETNQVIYQGKTKVHVNVKGGFKAGSFQIEFNLVQDVIQQVSDLFGISRDASAGALLAILGFSIKDGVSGLIQLIKWLNGRKIKKVEKQSDTGKITIHVENDSIETYTEALDLYRNIQIRKSLSVIIQHPLQKEGIETFGVRTENETPPVIVEKDFVDAFSTPSLEDEQLEDEVYKTDVQLTQISFKENIKWKFTDGSVEFYAIVLDQNFIEKVQESEASFSKDDILTVRIRKHKWIAQSGIKSEYEVEEVIHHRPAARQIPLDLE